MKKLPSRELPRGVCGSAAKLCIRVMISRKRVYNGVDFIVRRGGLRFARECLWLLLVGGTLFVPSRARVGSVSLCRSRCGRLV